MFLRVSSSESKGKIFVGLINYGALCWKKPKCVELISWFFKGNSDNRDEGAVCMGF